MRQPENAASDDMIRLLSDISRLAGFKMTRQQVEVLRELAGSGDGVSVDEIHLRLRSRLPRLSRETVRRTLAALERFGIVHKTEGSDKAARPSARRSSAATKRRSA